MPEAPTATPRVAREKILQIARALPADLSVLAQLGEMLQDINSELAEIATLLRRDVALGARIVRISNSATYGGSGEIASIEDAVNRVGFGEILKLVGSGAVSRFAERAVESYGISAEDLRGNMLFGAYASEALARKAGLDPRVAYTAGLVRPLGIMVLDRVRRSDPRSTPAYDAARWTTYSAWEEQHFGVNHADVAALILGEWRFPAEICEAIRSHALEFARDHEVRLAVVLNLANALSLRVNRGLPGEVAAWEITPQKLLATDLTPIALDAATEAAETACQAALAAFSG